LRVVAVKVGGGTSLMPDPRGLLTGRGAYVHPVSECLGLAERRRAFTRALRVAGPIDEGPLRRFVEGQPAEVHESGRDCAAPEGTGAAVQDSRPNKLSTTESEAGGLQ
jgi:predicted RNA-binding protein YlxR (DUF448 family)